MNLTKNIKKTKNISKTMREENAQDQDLITINLKNLKKRILLKEMKRKIM